MNFLGRLLIVIVLLGGGYLLIKMIPDPHAAHLSLSGAQLQVEIVDDRWSRIKGLSGRESLAASTGMLFEFDVSDHHGIWMKDMNFPIDIIWLDENLRVVHTESNVLPETFPTSFKPSHPARFVLEVNDGFVERYSVSVGDTATVDYVK